MKKWRKKILYYISRDHRTTTNYGRFTVLRMNVRLKNNGSTKKPGSRIIKIHGGHKSISTKITRLSGHSPQISHTIPHKLNSTNGTQWWVVPIGPQTTQPCRRTFLYRKWQECEKSINASWCNFNNVGNFKICHGISSGIWSRWNICQCIKWSYTKNSTWRIRTETKNIKTNDHGKFHI